MNVQTVGQFAVGDPSASRAVYLVVVALGAIGVLLAVLAIWLIRQTKPERELLAPLERMNDRSWRNQDPAEQRRTLDELRPDGAMPLTREPDVPTVDEDFEQPIPPLADFDDLRAQLKADLRNAKSLGGDPLLAPIGDPAEPSPISSDVAIDEEG